MSAKYKIIAALSSQVRQSNVKVPILDDKNPKIQDNNQAIHNGVIHEKSASNGMRSQSPPKRKGRQKRQS